ncbi:MAG: calcium-binding protein [Roseibium sp.]
MRWDFYQITKLAAGAIVSAIVLPVLWAEFIYPGWQSLKNRGVLEYQLYVSRNAKSVIPVYSCDWASVANILNELNDEQKDDELDFERFGFQVTEIQHAGKTYAMPSMAGSMVVKGEYGIFTVFKDGFAVYVSEQANPLDSHDEEFLLLLKDATGKEASRELLLDLRKVTRTENSYVDYGNQTDLATALDGVDYYRTDLSNLAMIMGWKSRDHLVGSIGNNAIFSWTDADTLVGGPNSDFLAGEHGSNTLVGGRGADHFDIHTDKLSSTDFDTLRDFDPIEGDAIGLAGLLTNRISILNYFQFLKVEKGTDHMDLFVDADGNNPDFGWEHVVRIEFHSDFSASQYSLFELVEGGSITTSSSVPESGRLPNGFLASL